MKTLLRHLALLTLLLTPLAASFENTQRSLLPANTNPRAPRQGLVFDGTRGASISGPTIGTSDFSAVFWVKFNNTASGYEGLTGGGSNAFAIARSPTGYLAVSLAYIAPIFSGTTLLSAQKWYQIVVTRSGNTFQSYVNSVADGTATTSINFIGQNVFLGANGSITDEPLNGVLSGALIYNRALSAAEVRALYESGAPSAADYNTASNTALTTGIFVGAYVSSTSSTGFTYAFNGNGYAVSNYTSFTLTKGQRLRLKGTVTLNGGKTILPQLYIDGTSSSLVALTSAGDFSIEVTCPTSPTGYIVAYAGGDANYTISNLTVTRIGLLLAPDAYQAGSGSTWYDTSGNGANITWTTGVSWGVPSSQKVASGWAFGGNVGIGTTTPASLLDVFHPTAAVADIHSNRENSGDTALLRFSAVSSTTADYRKGGIFYKSDGSGYGRGDFVFALDNVEDAGSVAITDAVMTLTRTGNATLAGNLTVGSSSGAFGQNSITFPKIAGGSYANGFYLYSGNTDNGSTNGFSLYDLTATAWRFTVTNSGNVLIGTTTDGGYKLDVNGILRTQSAIYITSGYGIGAVNGDNTLNNAPIFGGGGNSPNAGSLSFGNNTGWKYHIGTQVTGTFTPRLTVVDTGNVGIGTTAPVGKLDVQAESNTGNTILFRGGTYTNIAYATGVRFTAPASTTNSNRQFRFTSGDSSLTIQGTDGSGSDQSDTILSLQPSGGAINAGGSMSLTTAGSVYNVTSSGVDNTPAVVFKSIYSGNQNETNAILSGVSSTGTNSGWRFEASLGGGSDSRYPVLHALRDVFRVYTANTAALTIDSSQNAEFAANRIIISGAGASGEVDIRRASSAYGSTVTYRTTTALKWYHGLRGLSNDNWYLINETAANTALEFDAATSNATFAGSATLYTIGASSTGSNSLIYTGADGNGNVRTVAKIIGKQAGNGGYGNLVLQTAFNNSLVDALTIDSAQKVTANATTDASSTTTGALVVSGGVGISKKLYVGTDLYTNSINSLTGSITIKPATTGDAIVLSTFTGNQILKALGSGNPRVQIGSPGSDTGERLIVEGSVRFNTDTMILGTSKTPATAGATGTAGQIAWDASYIYICTATDTWKRVAIATW